MASGVTDLTALIAHLDANKSVVQTVEFALTMTPLDQEDRDAGLPAVYVYPGGMDASNHQPGETACSQSTYELIVVDYICAIADLTAATQEMRALILAYNLSAYHSSIAMGYPPRIGGSTAELKGIDGGVIWWTDKFEVGIDQRIGAAA